MSASSRAAARQARAQAQAQIYPVPAPIGGLNTKDAIANMPETDALVLDNIFCQPTWVEIRGGSLTLATFTGNTLTLLPYSSPAGANKLFAAVYNNSINSIFRVDNANGGSAGAAVVGGAGNTIQQITNPAYDYAQFGTNAAEILYLVNGSDLPLLYDGTTWFQVANSGGTYQLTGAPSSNPALLSQVAVYKKRLWFLQQNSMNVYYLAQSTFAGALTQLNLAPEFKLGGSIVAMITVSIDNTAGTNDYICFITNQGEALMFQGYDPAAVATWSEAAHFRIGAPVGTGRACWQKVGMDAMLICQDGFMMLSDAMLTDRAQIINKLSDKIRFGVNRSIATYGGNYGWQALIFPPGNKLIVNVPTNYGAGGPVHSFQYVMNTLTGAWSTWGLNATPLDATCFENFNNKFYYGKNGSVQQGDTGTSDNGSSITWSVQQAFTYLDAKSIRKRPTQVQPFIATGGAFSLSLSTAVDFKTPPAASACPLLSGNNQRWFGAQGEGFAVSISLSASTTVSAQWEYTNWMYEPLGTFYGK